MTEAENKCVGVGIREGTEMGGREAFSLWAAYTKDGKQLPENDAKGLAQVDAM
tara:strand:- start:281 stop:439 length:159 start_codon:yes stop_codon:yes gene_type:complete